HPRATALYEFLGRPRQQQPALP
ncbi:MAG: hypothetical protein K0R40_3041, partial [Burkholderiales bacterium]|nr:hypothetical protein [Burkholderiales bacterium]